MWEIDVGSAADSSVMSAFSDDLELCIMTCSFAYRPQLTVKAFKIFDTEDEIQMESLEIPQ